MQKKTLAIMGIVVLLGGGAFWAVKKSPTDSGTNTIIPSNQQTTENEIKADSSPGSYEAYSVEKLTEFKDKKKVIFFHAPWCPTCKILNENLEASEIPEDVAILKVDYDSSEDLKNKYGVTYQHTLVQVDENGNELKQWSNSYDIDEIKQEIQ